MAFNRVADEAIDKANPRTAMRALPAGLLSRQFVILFTGVACAVFVLAAAQLNRLTLYLSPVALERAEGVYEFAADHVDEELRGRLDL